VGVWGGAPSGEPLVRGPGGEAPLKLKSFEPPEDRKLANSPPC